MRSQFFLLTLSIALAARAQMPKGFDPPVHGELPLLAPSLARTEGVDAGSGIAYTRIFLTAKPTTPPPPDAKTLDLGQPTLTAQCTKDASGTIHFDLFFNFGDMADPDFYPPWKPTKERPNPAKTQYFSFNMEFVGYTSQRFKREFTDDWRPARQYRYNPPGAHSANLEPISTIMQRLNALPQLTISDNKRLVQFDTTPLLARLRTEPLCKASGL